MIAQITGTIVDQEPGSVVIDVSGLGHRVFITSETAEKLRGRMEKTAEKVTVSLFTHLAVRENALDLYGFIDRNERMFFEMLISISGIGPKSAISILSIADVPTLRDAVISEDISYLTKVSGIGKKSAQKIVLELSDKISALEEEVGGSMNSDIDTLDALMALGYSAQEVRGALKAIPKTATDTNERLKEALKILGK